MQTGGQKHWPESGSMTCAAGRWGAGRTLGMMPCGVGVTQHGMPQPHAHLPPVPPCPAHLAPRRLRGTTEVFGGRDVCAVAHARAGAASAGDLAVLARQHPGVEAAPGVALRRAGGGGAKVCISGQHKQAVPIGQPEGLFAVAKLDSDQGCTHQRLAAWEAWRELVGAGAGCWWSGSRRRRRGGGRGGRLPRHPLQWLQLQRLGAGWMDCPACSRGEDWRASLRAAPCSTLDRLGMRPTHPGTPAMTARSSRQAWGPPPRARRPPGRRRAMAGSNETPQGRC